MANSTKSLKMWKEIEFKEDEESIYSRSKLNILYHISFIYCILYIPCHILLRNKMVET